MKKIAVFHNFLDNIGGAEIVTLTLARELNADIYTTNVDLDKIMRMGFTDMLPRIKSIGRVPKNAPFRHQLTFWKFYRLKLGRTYDHYIIAGDWAMSGAMHNKPNLWYTHSPLNELWAFKDYIRKNMLSFWKRPLYDIWVWLNRILTLQYAKHIERWSCNSINTHNRVEKYYGKNPTIVHPPIYTKKYTYNKHENYWLSVNRLIPHKRIEMQLEAFRQTPSENLIIVGSFEEGAVQFDSYKKMLEGIMPKNVQILHWVDQEKLIDLYSRCTGVLATARDEDFGMSPVEAFASGKPVIAPNEGGYKETVVDGKTGILIDNMTSEKIIRAIQVLKRSSLEMYKIECQEHAAKFDTKIFIDKITKILNT